MNHLEAEYVYQLKKPVIPLMVEKNYTADGWLGFLAGAKFWVDFTDKENFKDGMNKLIRELGERGKIENELKGPIDVVDHVGKKNILSFTFLMNEH